jgi:hypothetical protein
VRRALANRRAEMLPMTSVLVVEDEDDIRHAVRWALEDAG